MSQSIRQYTFVITLAILCLYGCKNVPTPPAPSETRSGPALNLSELEFKGAIESQAKAAKYASNTLPDSNSKAAVQGPIGVVEALTAGTATTKQLESAMVPVLLALKGDLEKANAGWARSRDDAETLRQRLVELQNLVKAEREQAAAELTRQLQEARDNAKREADAHIRKLVGYIFFGGGFLLFLVTAGVLYFSATVPQLGPRVALFTGGAAFVSIASGLGIITLLNHPSIIWWGMGIVLALMGMASVAIWYNHLHAVKSGEITPSATNGPVVRPVA
jgi:hypothetical protein